MPAELRICTFQTLYSLKLNAQIAIHFTIDDNCVKMIFIITKWGNSVFTTSRWLFHERNEWNNDDELWKQNFLILWMEFFMEFEWNDQFVWICSPCIRSYKLLTQSYDIEFDRKFRTQLYGLDGLYAALKDISHEHGATSLLWSLTDILHILLFLRPVQKSATRSVISWQGTL